MKSWQLVLDFRFKFVYAILGTACFRTNWNSWGAEWTNWNRNVRSWKWTTTGLNRGYVEKIVGSFPQFFFFFFILFAFECTYIFAVWQLVSGQTRLISSPAGANLFLCDRYFKTRRTTIDTNSSISFSWLTLPQTLLIAAHLVLVHIPRSIVTTAKHCNHRTARYL